MSMLTFRTLCSGGELFGVGACQAGWTHVDGFEIDPLIAAVARLNGFDVRAADVCGVDYRTLAPADHLHASPSCKSASRANTTGGETPGDIAVADAICRAIRAHQGRSFSLENVWAYRNFESFARILAALIATGFVYDFWHINAADFGVPQTRKRLILRAVRRSWRERVPGLRPTHGKRGGILLARWRGWYSAIEDLLDTLPATQPALWQQARIPRHLRETTLIGTGGWDGAVMQRQADDPAMTLTSADNHAQIRAFIIGGGNTQLDQIGSLARWDDEPMFTVAASDGAKKVAAAFLVSGHNTGQEWGNKYRDGDDPAFTIDAATRSSHRPCAYLVSGQSARSGHWVSMTVQALGRFQTVPDDYIGLTPQINGNGVPCLLAKCIMESLV